MTYQSITTWQADPFEVEVRFGYFSTAQEAETMARQGIQSIFVDGLGLWVDLRDGTRAPIREGSFIIRRLREESRAAANHRALTIDDFERIEMSTTEMRKEIAMRSFGSQSYGVVDVEGKPVALSNQYRGNHAQAENEL